MTGSARCSFCENVAYHYRGKSNSDPDGKWICSMHLEQEARERAMADKDRATSDFSTGEVAKRRFVERRQKPKTKKLW